MAQIKDCSEFRCVSDDEFWWLLQIYRLRLRLIRRASQIRQNKVRRFRIGRRRVHRRERRRGGRETEEGLAMKAKPSVDFGDYWQRHLAA
jgi:hypothetical protein